VHPGIEKTGDRPRRGGGERVKTREGVPYQGVAAEIFGTVAVNAITERPDGAAAKTASGGP